MAERVVDELELVEVEHQQAERLVRPIRAEDLLTKPLMEEAVVEEPGQRVPVGQVASLLIQGRVVERHGGLVGHAPGHLERRVDELHAGRRVQLDEPDRPALRHQRQHQERAQAPLSEEVRLGTIGVGIVASDDPGDLLLEHEAGFRIAGQGKRLADLSRHLGREVAHRDHPVVRLVPGADRALIHADGLGQVAGHELRDLPRIEALGECRAHVHDPPQLRRQPLAPGEQPGGLKGGRRLVGEDRKELQVVRPELVEAELGQRDHADGALVVAHRHDEHRLVDLVGPGDRAAARVVPGVVDQQRDAVLRDPAREALAQAGAEHVEIDILKGADATLERDRYDLVGRFGDVHPGVVVSDDVARLLHDGPPDLLDRGGPAHPRGSGLQHGEVGRLATHPASAQTAGQEHGADQREGRIERQVDWTPERILVQP